MPNKDSHQGSAPQPVLTQLRVILQNDTAADRVALVWPEPLSHSELTAEVAGEPIRLVYCRSELAMREALVTHKGPERLILLSKFDAVQLANDVLARLWRNEPQRISPWKTLQQLIKVQQIDPRIERQRWMAEALLGSFDHYHKKITFGEVLDQENAWRALASSYLAYDADAVDLLSLFRWSIEQDVSDLVDKLPAKLKDNLAAWFDQPALECGNLLECLLQQGHGDDLLAIGLACSVLFNQQLAFKQLLDDQVLYAGRGRFSERFLGGAAIDSGELAEFGVEAEKTAGALLGANVNVHATLSKAEAILASLDFMPAVEISRILPAAFTQLLSNFACQLELTLQLRDVSLNASTLALVQAHALAELPAHREQIKRATMAVRLVRWLLREHRQTGSVNEILTEYIDHGGFVDWARSSIWSGDTHETLSKVYQQLSTQVNARREQQNKQFASHLGVIARGDKLAEGFVPVEQALHRLVAPIAAQKPLLLLVLDGMSQAVYRQLSADLTDHNWVEVSDSPQHAAKCLVAALPTVTEISRCSLLSGRLSKGQASDEKKAFTQHPDLKKLASTRSPPTLLHKSDLQHSDSGALAGEARSMLAGTEHRVLAAVFNAIDDQLGSSQQVNIDLTLQSMPMLRQLLEAAREAGRVVIITSDHGHVLEHNSTYANATDERGERYQLNAATASEYEVTVSGDRVVTTNNTVTLPWSETIRYSKGKNMGYHGGGSLQEVVIPVGVFVNVTGADNLAGWQEIPRFVPNWWDDSASAAGDEIGMALPVSSKKTPKLAKARQSAAAAERMDDMFSVDSADTAQDAEIKRPTSEWLDSFFSCEVYLQVRRRAGRAAIKEEQLRKLLELMEQHNWQLMEATIMRHLSLPKIRLRGFMAGAQKLLNVDGYPILAVDREAETIKLNFSDLKKQFEL